MKHIYKHLSILLIVCSIAIGFKAGDRDFWGSPGEDRRAEVSREMVASGNWAIPHLNGQPFVTKPPFYYWAAALTFTLRGKVDELGARIPSIISGTLGILVVYFWGWTLFSQRTGLLAGLILATSFLYGSMARTAGVDMMLTLFTTAALCCFSVGYQRRGKTTVFLGKIWSVSTGWYLLSWLWVGLGTFTKNPIGIAVPLLAVGGLILITRDWKLLLETKPWWGLLIVLLLILPWFYFVYQRVPNFFDILNKETFFRYTNPEESPKLRPFYYYIPTLGAFAPWVLLLPGMVISLFFGRTGKLSTSHIFLLTTFGTTFLLFSSVGSKQDYYLLPVYPVLAILVAKYWDDYLVMKARNTARWTWKAMDAPIVGLAGVLCLTGIAAPIGVTLYLPAHYLWLSVGFGLLFLGAGIALAITFWSGKAFQTFGLQVLAILLVYLFLLTVIVPELNAYRSRKAFCLEIGEIIGENMLVDYNYFGYAPQFYLQRIVPWIHSTEEMNALRQKTEPVFIIIQGGWYEELQEKHPEFINQFEVVLDRKWFSAVKPGKYKRFLLLKT